MLDDGGARVVNVKPGARLADPEIASALAWPKPLLGGRGLGYEVWSESDPVELTNVRFLSGYRVADRFDRGLVERAWAAAGSSETIGELVVGVSGVEREEALPVVLHLLWSGAVRADLSLPLDLGSRLLGVR
ncbi:MAG: hypothetical protein ACR2IP_03475 [Solirubrobacteraceae bacterium]